MDAEERVLSQKERGKAHSQEEIDSWEREPSQEEIGSWGKMSPEVGGGERILTSLSISNFNTEGGSNKRPRNQDSSGDSSSIPSKRKCACQWHWKMVFL